MNDKHVSRVKSIKLCRFRGFVNDTPIELNTDADIVLLTGPNGFGKTSFVDALCLLLNRHYYSERLPLSSCNGENHGETYIEAVVKYAENESDTVKVTVGENSKKQPEIVPLENSWIGGISKELAARCSFFYQDLLSKLFEEEDAQVGLLEFLSPKPENVQKAQDAVRQALKQWKADSDNILKSFAQKDFPSEGDINEKRKKAVVAFRDAWNEMVKAARTEMQITLPERDRNWLFLINSENLRAGWQNELRSWGAECLDLLMPNGKQLGTDEKPSVVLHFIEEAMSQLRYKVINQMAGSREKLKLLLDDIPNDAQVFPPSNWPEKEKEISGLSKEVRKLEMQLTLFEKLERHFDNPKGPNLVEVLTALRDQGKMWLEVPEVSPDISPPLSIIEWLRKIGIDDLDRLIDRLEEWQSRIGQKRFELQQRVFDKQKEMQNQSMLLEKSKKIFYLLEQTGLNSELKDFKNSDTPIPSSILKERMSSFTVQPS